MKKIILSILLLTTLGAITSCKKHIDISPSTNTSTGAFIEFKIDGHFYRMEESYTNTSDFVTGLARHFDLTVQQQLNIAFAHSTSDEGVGLIISDSSVILSPHYTILPYNANTNPFISGVFSYVMPDDNEYITGATTSGLVDFSKIDTIIGKPVEGTFSFDNLELKDVNGNTISTGHKLTDGKFKTVVK